MDTLGEMTLAGYRLPIHHATFRRITDDGQGQPGWEFNVCTQPPVEEPAGESERFLFANGVRFYAEGDPIPLPDADDLTGVEVYIEEPFDPDSGEVYFTLYVGEHQDVSCVRLRFLERRGSQYRVRYPPSPTTYSRSRPSWRSSAGSRVNRRGGMGSAPNPALHRMTAQLWPLTIREPVAGRHR